MAYMASNRRALERTAESQTERVPMTAEEFARSVRGATRPPDPSGWWRALCPAHDDNQPSLSFRDGKNGLLVRCHAGCLDEAVLGAVEKAAGSQPGAAVRTIDKAYRYTDAAGNLLYEVVRFKPKTFRQRRPNGSGGWIWDMKGVPRVLYRLNELRGHRVAYVPEGEKDVDRLWSLGLAATTNPGGAGKWQPEFVDQLKIAGIELVVVIPDSDDPGRAHAQDIARACALGGLSARIVTLDLSTGGDISDWLDGGHKKGELIFLAKRASNFQAMEVPGSPPWAAARPAPEFIAEKDLELNFLVPKLLLPGNVTMLFSPRGIGKTLMAHALAVDLAKKNHRVLLVDRDNSSQLLRSRLKNWGASEAQNLDILTRDKAPALTDGKAWKSFPEKYDLVIIDSLDAATEGVGEGDSAKPSKALAAILDIAHRSGERAAFLVLGNTVKSGAHSRGSGVIEDRGDIVYEVRDATGFSPSGKVSWWLELPGQGAGAWGERARRRPTQRMYRLALVNSKFRPGSEPEPFILQVEVLSRSV